MNVCVCVYIYIYYNIYYIYIIIYIIYIIPLFYSSLESIYYLVCKCISYYEVDMIVSQQNECVMLMDKMSVKTKKLISVK
jgi:hypothetical protein